VDIKQAAPIPLQASRWCRVAVSMVPATPLARIHTRRRPGRCANRNDSALRQPSQLAVRRNSLTARHVAGICIRPSAMDFNRGVKSA